MIFERKVRLAFSAQAELQLKNMPRIDKEELVEWFTKTRRISIGGGDVIDYLAFKEGGN